MTTQLFAFLRSLALQALATLAFVLSLLLGGCASMGIKPVKEFTMAEIVSLSKEGKSPTAIVETLREGGATYSYAASELVDLSKQGVSVEVLDYLQETHLRQVRRQERLRTQDVLQSGWVPWGSFGGRGIPTLVYIHGRPYWIHRW